MRDALREMHIPLPVSERRPTRQSRCDCAAHRPHPDHLGSVLRTRLPLEAKTFAKLVEQWSSMVENNFIAPRVGPEQTEAACPEKSENRRSVVSGQSRQRRRAYYALRARSRRRAAAQLSNGCASATKSSRSTTATAVTAAVTATVRSLRICQQLRVLPHPRLRQVCSGGLRPPPKRKSVGSCSSTRLEGTHFPNEPNQRCQSASKFDPRLECAPGARDSQIAPA